MATSNYKYKKPLKIDWLENIPDHWEEVRLGSLFNQRKEKVSDTDYPPLSVTKNGVLPQLENAAKSNDGDNRKLVLKGDFAINSRSDRKGSSGISIYDGSVSLIYTILKPVDIEPRYSEYLLKSYYFKEEYYRYGRGIVEDLWTTKYSEMKNMIIPSAPKSEQTAIANFLDYKLEKIERFLIKKEYLIVLLRERINTYIQKSFDIHQNKDSDFWPTINSSWNIEKAKRIFQEIRLTNFPEEDLLAATQDRGVIPKRLCEQNFVLPTSGLPNQKLVEKDDFVISLRSFQGGIEFSEYRGIVSPAYTVIRLLPRYQNESFINYYKYLFKTKQFIGLLNTAISGIRDGKNINWSDFSELLIPVPDFKDLAKLRNYVSIYEKQKLIFKKEKKIILEYREALIAETVIGKINVRDFEILQEETLLAVVTEETEN